MADKELIIGLLEKVRRQMRFRKRALALSKGLCIAFIIPIIFKLIDLLSPFRGSTVVAFLVVWAIATILWLSSKSRGQESLSNAAAQLDREARLQDQMKTAYWFIGHPPAPPSEWVTAQITRTAQDAARMNAKALYPASLPRIFYGIPALLLVLMILNFLPQSRDHNWFYFQGAPPFHLSHRDQALVDHARKLLADSDASNKLNKIVSDLEKGKISSSLAQQQLSELRQQIDGGNLELNNILDGLTSMANQLAQSDALASTAQAMSQGDLSKAADEIRSLAEKLGVTPADVLREMQQNMSQAASSSPASVQDLSKLMQEAADAVKSEDPQTGKIALDNLAQALEQLEKKMTGQQQQSQASQQLADLQNALQQEAASAEAASDAQLVPIPSQGGSGGGGSADGEQSANGTPSAGDASGDAPGSQAGGSDGSTAFGSPNDLKPGEMTKLDVQLKMQGLKGQASQGGQLQDIEEASRQERSAMDYRNVPSELSPAQKDALNQNRLPREQREIVKYYFEEIRPQSAKPIK